MTATSSSNGITFKVLLPQINHPLSGPPPTPRVNISGPTTLKSFPLHRVDFLNSDLRKLVLKRPTYIMKCKKVLGHGDGGSVYEVKYPLMKESYALKVVERVSAFQSTDKFGKDGIRTEITLAKKLHHPHITDFKAVFCDLDHHYLLTEVCEHGVGPIFNEPESRLLMLQVISAVSYLHQLGVSHNDLYPRNILVGQGSNDKGLALKLADFGWAEIKGPQNYQFDSSMSDLLYTGWSAETDLELLPDIL
ncbi:kinase-like domain-containing protein [Melampsora americana]|nr:kinase-like domain-containing protein [Melampsora americana]